MAETATPLFLHLDCATKIDDAPQLLERNRVNVDGAFDMLGRLNQDMCDFYDDVYKPHFFQSNPDAPTPEISHIISEYMGQLSVLTEQDHIKAARALIQHVIDSGQTRIRIYDKTEDNPKANTSDKYMIKLVTETLEKEYPGNKVVVDIVHPSDLENFSLTQNDTLYIIDDAAYSGKQKRSLVREIIEDLEKSNAPMPNFSLFFAGSTRRARDLIQSQGKNSRINIYCTKEIPGFSDLSKPTQHFVASYILHKSELVEIAEQDSPTPENRELTYLRLFMNLLSPYVATITAYKVPDAISILRPSSLYRPINGRTVKLNFKEPWSNMLHIFDSEYKEYPNLPK